MKRLNIRRVGHGPRPSSATTPMTLIRCGRGYILPATLITLACISFYLHRQASSGNDGIILPAGSLDADDLFLSHTRNSSPSTLQSNQAELASKGSSKPAGDPPRRPVVEMEKSVQFNRTELVSKGPSKPASDPPQRPVVEKENSIHVSQSYLKYLRGLEPFPRRLHVLFPHKDFYKREPPLPFVKHGMLRFIELNPTWNVTVYDDTDMDLIIAKAADDKIISLDEKNVLLGNETHSGAHAVERADFARLLLIWYYGGMYVDVDTLINPKDFSARVFTPTIKMCLPTFMDVNFAQSIVCSSPKNQMYIDIIKQMSEYRMHSNNGGPIERRGGWAKGDSLFSMGPPMYNRIIVSKVFGETITGHGKIPGLGDCVKALQKEAGDVIATGKLGKLCENFIADPYEGCKSWGREELYQLYNMSRWSEAAQKRWEETFIG